MWTIMSRRSTGPSWTGSDGRPKARWNRALPTLQGLGAHRGRGEKREVSTGMLTGGYFGWRGGCDEPATKKHGGGKTHSVPSAEEHGEVELSGPNGCG
jgi:hypothetical protein